MFDSSSRKSTRFIIVIIILAFVLSYIEIQEKISLLYENMKNKLLALFFMLKKQFLYFMIYFNKKTEIEIEKNKVFIGTPLIFRKIIQKLVRTKGLRYNFRLFKILSKLNPSPHINFLYELSKYYRDTIKIISENTQLWDETCNQKIFINFPIWGERCADLFITYMAPSLLSEGNLPNLQKKNSFHIQIFCDNGAREIILKSDVYKSILQYAKVHIFHIHESLLLNMQNIEDASNKETAKYLLYGTSQCLGAHQAIKQKAYISFLNADTLIAANALSNSVDRMMKGEKMAVLVNAFRSNLDTIKDDLKKYYDRTKNIISLPSDDLVHLQVKHIHPSSLRRIISPSTKYFNIVPQMVFYTGDEMVSRSAHYHPFMLSYQVLKKFKLDSGFPIDGDSGRLILPFKDNFDKFIEVIEDSKKIGVLELSSENVEPANMNQKKYNTYEELLSKASKYFINRSIGEGEKYLLSKRTVYRSDHKSHSSYIKSISLDPIDDTIFIMEMMERLKNS